MDGTGVGFFSPTPSVSHEFLLGSLLRRKKFKLKQLKATEGRNLGGTCSKNTLLSFDSTEIVLLNCFFRIFLQLLTQYCVQNIPSDKGVGLSGDKNILKRKCVRESCSEEKNNNGEQERNHNYYSRALVSSPIIPNEFLVIFLAGHFPIGLLKKKSQRESRLQVGNNTVIEEEEDDIIVVILIIKEIVSSYSYQESEDITTKSKRPVVFLFHDLVHFYSEP